MTDEADLLILADRCRFSATLTTDESIAQSLNRLADGYETQAKVCRYLADGSWSMDRDAHAEAVMRAHDQSQLAGVDGCNKHTRRGRPLAPPPTKM
jgi:hypothetical protein